MPRGPQEVQLLILVPVNKPEQVRQEKREYVHELIGKDERQRKRVTKAERRESFGSERKSLCYTDMYCYFPGPRMGKTQLLVI